MLRKISASTVIRTNSCLSFELFEYLIDYSQLINPPQLVVWMDRPSIIRVNFRLNESFFCIKSTTNLMNCLLIIFLPSQISNITLNIATIHFKNKNFVKTCYRKYPNCACAGWCSSCTEFFVAREEKSGNHARNFTLFVTLLFELFE